MNKIDTDFIRLEKEFKQYFIYLHDIEAAGLIHESHEIDYENSFLEQLEQNRDIQINKIKNIITNGYQ